MRPSGVADACGVALASGDGAVVGASVGALVAGGSSKSSVGSTACVEAVPQAAIKKAIIAKRNKGRFFTLTSASIGKKRRVSSPDEAEFNFKVGYREIVLSLVTFVLNNRDIGPMIFVFLTGLHRVGRGGGVATAVDIHNEAIHGQFEPAGRDLDDVE